METPTLLGDLERANLNHWKTHVSILVITATNTPDPRLSRREVTGKHAINIVMKHAQGGTTIPIEMIIYYLQRLLGQRNTLV
jgi:hypothetical protein